MTGRSHRRLKSTRTAAAGQQRPVAVSRAAGSGRSGTPRGPHSVRRPGRLKTKGRSIARDRRFGPRPLRHTFKANTPCWPFSLRGPRSEGCSAAGQSPRARTSGSAQQMAPRSPQRRRGPALLGCAVSGSYETLRMAQRQPCASAGLRSAQVEKPSTRRCSSQSSGRGAADNKVLHPSSGGWRPSAMRCTMSGARNKCMGVRSFSSTIRSATMTRSPNCESRGSPSANTRAESLPGTATPTRKSTASLLVVSSAVHPMPSRTAPKMRRARSLHRSLD